MTQTWHGSLSRSDVSSEVAALETRLVALRGTVATTPFALELPGTDEARLLQRDITDQIDSYVLPRLRSGDKPLLVTVAGSTGAGKSTLVNSLVGAQVSNTGVRRPTTNSPVLACHPDDVAWFGEDRFLPTLPRVRQQGLAMPGRDGILVLAGLEGMHKGVALLDTPDIDSVVKDHHRFARQFLGTADLWLFVTTAARYADARVWEWLRWGAQRDASMAVVLSRVPPSGEADLKEHFSEMLAAGGLESVERFYIPETEVSGGRLPEAVSAELSAWLRELADDAERRTTVTATTLTGTLHSFTHRVPELAGQVKEQVEAAAQLRKSAELCYSAAAADIEQSIQDGSLLRGEVLARWQDFTGTGDLFRAIQARQGRGHRQAHKKDSLTRLRALKTALQASLQSAITSGATRAARDVVHLWEDQPAGRELLEAGRDRLAKSSPELPGRIARALGGWQDEVRKLVQSETKAKRSVVRLISLDDQALALVFMVALIGGDAVADSERAGTPGRLLKTLFGPGPLREVNVRAGNDLRERINRLYEEEALRFGQLIDAARVADESVVAQLQRAKHNLEIAVRDHDQ